MPSSFDLISRASSTLINRVIRFQRRKGPSTLIKS
ncbi:hypothetical protein AAZX31_11G047100 [Glycine max]